MSFPDTDLPVVVEAAFGADLTDNPASWTWTDLSSRLHAQPISIRAGRSDGAQETAAGTCTVVLDNDDGALTPLHPASQFYPHIRVDPPVPMRVRLDHDLIDAPAAITDTFGRTESPWSATDTGQVYTNTGGGGTLADANFNVGSGVATHSVPAASAFRMSYLAGVELTDVDQTIVASVPVTAAGGALELGNLMARIQDVNNYYLFRAEINTSQAVRVSIHKVGTGGTQLGSTVTVPGVTYTAGKQIAVRGQIHHQTLRIKAWDAAGAEPDGWLVEATNALITAAGGVGVRSGIASGNSNPKPVVFTYDNWQVADLDALVRAAGYADSWKPEFLPAAGGTVHSTVTVTTSGVLRRLGQGAAPLRSAIHRYLTAVSPRPVAYWPLEDGPLAIAGEPVFGKSPLTPWTGTHPSGAAVAKPRFGRGALGPWLPDTLAWSANKGLAIMRGHVSMPTTTTTWTVDHVYAAGTAAPITVIDVNPSYLGGAAGWPQLRVEPEFGEIGIAINGEPEVYGDAPQLFDGLAHHIRWTCSQSGANVSWAIRVDGVTVASGTTSGAMTLPPIEVIGLVAEASTGSDVAVGYVAVWAGSPATLADTADAALGHAGEPAAERIERLGDEEGVPVSVSGDAGLSHLAGPQRLEPFVTTVAAAAAVDGGVLSERAFGLHYRTVGDRYNLDPALTVDLGAYRVARGESPAVLAPQYDDQRIRNRWTASRRDGGTVTYTDPAATVIYDDQTQLDVSTDAALPHQASWRVHLGTVDEMRFPALPIDLAANPDLVDGWLAVRLGDRIDRTNVPDPYGVDDIRQVLEGYTEILGPRSWQVQAVCSPYEPYRIAEVESDGLDVLGSDGSTVNTDFDAGTDTSLSVAVAAGYPLWVTGSADFDIDAGGVVLHVTNISGASSPQTFTVDAAPLNGVERTVAAGLPVDVHPRVYLGL